MIKGYYLIRHIIQKWIIFIIFIMAVLLHSCSNLAQAEITDNVAVRCLVGEASGERYEGLLAVAQALRNRDTIRGVYGCNARHIEPEWVWELARKAWRESFQQKVDEANEWRSTLIKGEDQTAKGLIFVKQVGNHRFYLSKARRK